MTISGRGLTGGRVGVLHIHSDYSRDGHDTLEELHAWAVDRGIDFIAMTDHAEDFVPELFDEYVAHCASLSDDRVTIIAGLEFRFAGYTGLHLLALGLTEWIQPTTPAEFAEQASRAARFTIVAHPVLASYKVPAEVRAKIDAVEIWNASYNTRYLPDPRAIDVLREIRASRPEVFGTAGLDQHDRTNDRRTRVFTGPTNDPLGELKAGRFTSAGQTMRFDAPVAMSSARFGALKLVRWAFDRVERTQERMSRAFARG